MDLALHMVSAWDGEKLVGYARLEGSKLSVEITDVLVCSAYQGKGIATEMVARLMTVIKALDPYSIQVAPSGKQEAHLYERFGFKVIPYYFKMEYINDKLLKKVAQIRGKDIK